ncbi:MAG: FecR family protein, partial [Mariniphaga sp.]|nr:FecR family protein [Mariniphaga sp.]
EYTVEGKIKVNQEVFEAIKTEVPELNQLVIPYGKTSEIILPDGSKVYLNAGSRLVYPEFFADKNREVFLVGEAFFEVKQDKSHPFIVQTVDLNVKALGTKFNVLAYPSDNIVQVVLTEGEISLEQNKTSIFSESIELKPNQLATFDKSTKEVKLEVVEAENYTLWKDGLCKFESIDLNRITKKLERFYKIRFHYTNSMLGMIKISGKLELNENREEIINRVAVAASLEITKVGENYYEIGN